MESPALPEYPAFSLSRLIRTVFDPTEGMRIVILIDLEDPEEVTNFNFLANDDYSVQRYAHDVFYRGLHQSTMKECGMSGGDFFAYKITGGSNLDLPDMVVAPDGSKYSLDLLSDRSSYRLCQAVRISGRHPARC